MAELDSISTALEEFYANIKSGTKPFEALHKLVENTVGAILFTVMEVDLEAGLAIRSYTSDQENYSASGSKPIHRDDWFELVCVERQPFVANTIKDIEKVFPDFDLIWSLGCGSVVNLPIIIRGDFVGTINLLHEEHYYTSERVEIISKFLSKPSVQAYFMSRNSN